MDNIPEWASGPIEAGRLRASDAFYDSLEATAVEVCIPEWMHPLAALVFPAKDAE